MTQKESLRSRLKALQQEVQHLKAQNQHLKAKVADASSSLSPPPPLLAAADADATQPGAEIKESKVQLEAHDASAQLEEAHHDLARLRTERDKQVAEAYRLGQQEIQVKLDAAERRLAEQDRAYEARKRDLSDQLETARTTLATMTAERDQKAKKLTKTAAELKRYVDEAEVMKASFEFLQEQLVKHQQAPAGQADAASWQEDSSMSHDELSVASDAVPKHPLGEISSSEAPSSDKPSSGAPTSQNVMPHPHESAMTVQHASTETLLEDAKPATTPSVDKMMSEYETQIVALQAQCAQHEATLRVVAEELAQARTDASATTADLQAQLDDATRRELEACHEHQVLLDQIQQLDAMYRKATEEKHDVEKAVVARERRDYEALLTETDVSGKLLLALVDAMLLPKQRAALPQGDVLRRAETPKDALVIRYLQDDAWWSPSDVATCQTGTCGKAFGLQAL
ncbi:hypothetical protein CXG81DRAFT_26258 [Caulochytrium protostelioides]|uniref:Uncharacterized protein n=1 Tax=Caulochytrium protostelioides TaxID=1555241 RepID=A0A4P9X781_9FUNG|nr:hypothetical protein CXG81DRAFT_26258 [Caulochytrium protostelioides]|eukprot:RKP01062.1 hypothetical protein CXG81DRAFT_26258 [Caulochytrium protostelioides]